MVEGERYIVVDAKGRETKDAITEARLIELTLKGFIAPQTEIWDRQTGRHFRAFEHVLLHPIFVRAGRITQQHAKSYDPTMMPAVGPESKPRSWWRSSPDQPNTKRNVIALSIFFAIMVCSASIRYAEKRHHHFDHLVNRGGAIDITSAEKMEPIAKSLLGFGVSDFEFQFGTPDAKIPMHVANAYGVDWNYRFDDGEIDALFTLGGHLVQVRKSHGDW